MPAVAEVRGAALPAGVPRRRPPAWRRRKATGTTSSTATTGCRGGSAARPRRSSACRSWPRSTRWARSRTTRSLAGSRRSPLERLRGRSGVIADADRILAPTPEEAGQLVGLYGADPERIRIVPPGVDHSIFFPADRAAARARLHLSGLRLALFVGRLQSHKGPDVAVRTLAEAVARDPEPLRSGAGDRRWPQRRASRRRGRQADGARLGARRERPGDALPAAAACLGWPMFYAAADVVLVPSRSESFGLVALEAQACGTPVVAAAVGGLRFVVRGRTGSWSRDTTRPITPKRMLADPRRSRVRRAARLRRRAGVAGLHVGRHGVGARAASTASSSRPPRDPGRAGAPPAGRGARLPADPRLAERPRGLVAHGLRGAVLPGRHRGEREARHGRGIPVHHRGRGTPDRPDRASTTSAAATGSARCTSSSATATRGGRGSEPRPSTRCWHTSSGGSTSIRSSSGRSPRTSARSAPTRTRGSGRKRGSPERSWKDGRWVDRVLMSVTRENFERARTAREQRER